MIEKITEWLMNWAERKGRVLKITGTGGPDDIYLIRYFIIRSRFFNFYIHQFLRSDRDDLHDHPWDFMTYLVRGSYIEYKWNEERQKEEKTYRMNYVAQRSWGDKRLMRYKDNTLVFRRATDQHKVIVNQDLKEKDKAKAPLTLFFSGPKKREWGFWTEAALCSQCWNTCKKCGSDCNICEPQHVKIVRQWVPWREYLGLPPGEPGRG